MDITSNLGNLNSALSIYQGLRKWSAEDVLKKQGKKLINNVKGEMRKITGAKGSIRAKVLDRLAGGKMIKVRDSVIKDVTMKFGGLKGMRFIGPQMPGRYGAGYKFIGPLRPGQLSWELNRRLVEREINVRESGRGVLRVSASFPGGELQQGAAAKSRRGFPLADFGFRVGTAESVARFTWRGEGEVGKTVAKAFDNARPLLALMRGVDNTTKDIVKYIAEKQVKLAQQAMKEAVKQ